MRLLRVVLLIAGLASLHAGVSAQLPSAAVDPGQADSTPQVGRAQTPEEPQSARSFKGTIVRTGAQLVLKESSAHTLYKLDDQKKAKEYEGKRVIVTATMDSSSNTLRVIDIVAAKRQMPPKKQ
ncbi:MAG TPA: DUF5818 domain-containing protein [Candidatus Sulfotelmatobacter sp.]|nr:DUF5818 domain-containing protein [Candidatus Sulfotelmatobacter sp.]